MVATEVQSRDDLKFGESYTTRELVNAYKCCGINFMRLVLCRPEFHKWHIVGSTPMRYKWNIIFQRELDDYLERRGKLNVSV